MASKTSQLIVELLDRVSGPAKKAAGALNSLRGTAEAGGGVQARLNGALDRANTSLEAARGGLFDAVGAYYAFRGAVAAPLQAAADFETALEDIAQKAGLPSENLDALGQKITEVARQTNQAASEVAAGVDAMVGRGASIETALAVADPIGRAATAYRAATEDLAATAMTATDNLKVPAEQMGRAFDVLAQAGKAGAFELADMARFMPDLGARYAAFGQEGVGALADLAAAAQVVRKDTGDAGSAATRLGNVLQKTYSPATVKKFADQGIDLISEMEKAAARGLTPLEAIAEITNNALGGDLTKLGILFEDAEAQAGLRSLIQHREEYQRIREEALKAQGVVMKDYQRRVRTAAGAQARWNAALETLKVTLGSTLVPIMSDLLDRIVPLIARLGDWIAANPRLVGGIVAATGALIAFKGALAALRFVGLLGTSGALSLLAAGMSTVGAAAIRMGGAARGAVALQTALGAMAGGQTLGVLSKLGIGLRAAVFAVPGVSALSGAIAAIGAAVATISAPIWGAFALAAAAVAAAGVAIWKYWDRITAVLSGVGQAIGEILAPAFEKIRPVLDWFAPLGDAIAAGWERAKGAIAAVGDWLGSVFSKEVLSEDDKANAKQAGYDFIMSLWEGMKQVMSDLLQWVKDKAAELLAPFAGLGNAIKSILPSSTVTAADNPAGELAGIEGRAVGGPIRKGRPYIVGEEGPELIVPRSDGFVHTAAETAAMTNGGSRPAPGGGRAAAPRISLKIDVHPSPGMDEESLARRVASRIEDGIASALRNVQADTGMETYG
jgi:TP901 family phage tail tape measure protein